MDCERLHGAPANGMWVPQQYISMVSSKYCARPVTQGFDDFFGNLTESTSVDYGTSTGGVDVIGNKTDVSLYFTASSGSSGAGTMTTASGSASTTNSNKASAGSTGVNAAASNTAGSSAATSTGSTTGTAAPAKATGNSASAVRATGIWTVMLGWLVYNW